MRMDTPPCLHGARFHSFMAGSRVCMRCRWAPRELRQPVPVRRRYSALDLVLNHWGRTCVFCGAEATTRDHLVPRSRGGSNGLQNLRPCCKPCNQKKGDRTPAEWLGRKCPGWMASLTAPTKESHASGKQLKKIRQRALQLQAERPPVKPLS